LLTKPAPKLTKPQELAVKKVARDLLEKLEDQLAITDWRIKQQTRASLNGAALATELSPNFGDGRAGQAAAVMG
jgi:hypothetical protein